MVFRLVFLSIAFTLAGCSIYKSQDRKDFEGTSPSRVFATGLTATGPTAGLVAALGDCQTMNAVPAWFAKQFPGPTPEMLIASDELEVWKQTGEEGSITVRSFRAIPNGTRACSQSFASERDFEKNRASYLNLLASPVLD